MKIIFFCLLITISIIDILYKIIPDCLSLPGIIIGILLNTFSNTGCGFKQTILGILIEGGIFLIVACISQGGVGGGDIKLAAMIGSFAGLDKVLLIIPICIIVGVGFDLLRKIFGWHTQDDSLPFAPFLSLGTLIYLYCF